MIRLVSQRSFSLACEYLKFIKKVIFFNVLQTILSFKRGGWRGRDFVKRPPLSERGEPA